MPIFKSLQPDISLPDPSTTIFDFFFPGNPSSGNKEAGNGGYTDVLTSEHLSYSAVARHAAHISTALARTPAYAFAPGDTLALFSHNCIWYPVAMFAAVRLGGRVSGASPAYGVEEMTYALRTAKAKFLATAAGSLDIALAAAKEVGIPKERIFLLEGQVEGFTSVRELVEIGRRMGEGEQVPSWKIPAGKANSEVCAFLSFSSGTTGLPKAVMIAHSNVIAQCLQVRQITPPTHKKILAVLPLFHITGLVHGLHLPILLDAEVLMLPSFTMPSMLAAVVKHQVEELLLVPPILIRLVRDPVVAEYDLSCVKRFSSGAAPLSDEIIQLLKKKFPGTGFKQGYGQTESCSCITAHPPSLYDYQYAHAVGTIVAATEVKVITEDGREGGVGEAGELLARGPQVVMGYLDNAAATRETFDANGWLHTGDQGMVDAQGLVHILDRIKELIKVKGIGIAPAELEDLLLGHAKVEDVAVLGVKDDYSGELPKAYVVLKQGASADEATGKEILQYVKDKKVRYKWVKEVEFIQEIPKSASGKILRRVLRDKAKSDGAQGFVVRDEAKARL